MDIGSSLLGVRTGRGWGLPVHLQGFRAGDLRTDLVHFHPEKVYATICPARWDYQHFFGCKLKSLAINFHRKVYDIARCREPLTRGLRTVLRRMFFEHSRLARSGGQVLQQFFAANKLSAFLKRLPTASAGSVYICRH